MSAAGNRRPNRSARDLGKMHLPQLVRAFFAYPTILFYLALAVACAGAAWTRAESVGPIALAVAVTCAGYPFVEYGLHRFVLHGRFLYKSPLTAALWKRIHFDHHQHPDDLAILFGAAYTTLPVVAVTGLATGQLAGGPGATWAAFATGLALLCAYEFVHCVHHLGYLPRSPWLKRMKQRHLAHHYHAESGNYGIVTDLVDRLAGTAYERAADTPRSPTVRNLGYTDDEAARFPWVRRLSGPPPDPGAAQS